MSRTEHALSMGFPLDGGGHHYSLRRKAKRAWGQGSVVARHDVVYDPSAPRESRYLLRRFRRGGEGVEWSKGFRTQAEVLEWATAARL